MMYFNIILQNTLGYSMKPTAHLHLEPSYRIGGSSPERRYTLCLDTKEASSSQGIFPYSCTPPTHTSVRVPVLCPSPVPVCLVSRCLPLSPACLRVILGAPCVEVLHQSYNWAPRRADEWRDVA
jgi:hypothetical protein